MDLRKGADILRSLGRVIPMGMSRDTKFGYGFLLLGAGMPYLIDQLLGLGWAIVVSVACVVVGGAFLIAGHRHKEGMVRSWKIWELLIFGAALVTLVALGSVGALRMMHREPTVAESLADGSSEWAGKIRHLYQDWMLHSNISTCCPDLDEYQKRRANGPNPIPDGIIYQQKNQVIAKYACETVRDYQNKYQIAAEHYRDEMVEKLPPGAMNRQAMYEYKIYNCNPGGLIDVADDLDRLALLLREQAAKH